MKKAFFGTLFRSYYRFLIVQFISDIYISMYFFGCMHTRPQCIIETTIFEVFLVNVCVNVLVGS